LKKAVNELLGLLQDYHFASPSDKSRAVAGMLSPALRAGKLVEGDCPMNVVEADQSQAGKTKLTLVVHSLYNERAYPVTTRDKSGVGSFQESIAQGIRSGRFIIGIDNAKGNITCPLLDMTIRGLGEAPSRTPNQAELVIRTVRLMFTLSSNGADMSQDLANRSV